jgi:DNA helicase-2/ATP-dependent DNA helicase PcrA
MNLDRDLNPQQREAVLHQGGPLLVLAGAGSGKTRALTYRIAHLILHRRIAPRNILAITFTNKAAEEMRLRVQRLLGMEKTGIWIGTFHATCARILRRHIEHLGYRSNFVIYDSDDQLRVIRSCIKRLRVEGKQIQPVAVQSLLDKAKNQGIDPALLVPSRSPLRQALEEVVALYKRSLLEANALDFGDLLLLALRLLDEFPEVRASYREQFRFILVDEYQDTNRAQHILLQRLASKATELCVVGDDDQSIYRWRGAEVNNLLAFEQDFPGARILALEQNYRSTQTILRAADAVARGNPKRREKRLWTANEPGERLVYLETATPEEEATWIAKEIQSLVALKQIPYRHVGVFFRTNAQSRPFEERFVHFRIPHAVIGSIRFYERAEVKDLLAYLRLLYNPDDSASLLRILNQPPRGIGPATQETLRAYAERERKSLWGAIQEALEKGALSGTPRGRLERFQNLIRSLLGELDRGASLEKLLEAVVERTGYRGFLGGREDGERRLENVEEFLRTAGQFQEMEASEPAGEVLAAFLQRVALVSDTDQYEDRANCVSLMTLHCAKGLEFPVVFLAGLEDGVLPHQRSYASPEALAEERRLCYVGMTRARDKLYLSRACLRSLQGERQFTDPSPFLASIPPDLIEVREPQGKSHSARRTGPLDRTEKVGDCFLDYEESQLDRPRLPPVPSRGPAQKFRIGERIEHESLGAGVVRNVEGSGYKEKITVQFRAGKIRKLMAEVSPIKKVTDP